MIYVTSFDSTQSEPLNNIGDDFRLEQSTDGTFTASFSTYPDSNPAYDLLKVESVLTVEGNDFRVKQASQNMYGKTITAMHVFYDLIKRQVHAQLNGIVSLSERLAFVLAGTGFTYTIDSAIANKVALINSFGKTNVVALLNQLCTYYECEFIINGNNVHIAAQIGPDNDYQYRYKHNVSSVVMKEDTSNLYTKIVGYGANGLTVTYTSPNATIFGELEAEPIEDDRYTNADNLLSYIKQQIVDVPEVAIETSIPELTSRSTGERVWLIYEPLKIEIQTRILKQTKTLCDGKLITSSVVLGNTVIKSSTDLIVEQKQEYTSGISDTNERVDVVKTDVAGAVASIEVLEGEIELKVDANGIIAAINISPETVRIDAPKINLNGAVMVNGSITGSTNINIYNDAYIGNNLYLQGASTSGIHFADSSYIQSINGGMQFEAWNQMIIHAPYVYAYGIWDFSYATVVGI